MRCVVSWTLSIGGNCLLQHLFRGALFINLNNYLKTAETILDVHGDV